MHHMKQQEHRRRSILVKYDKNLLQIMARQIISFFLFQVDSWLFIHLNFQFLGTVWTIIYISDHPSMLKIASQAEILSYFKSAYGKHKYRYYGFYNSQFNQIITQEEHMVIPVDDRTATRAHGVFDVLYVKKKCIVNMDQHISRLFKSAASVNIVPPFDKEKTEQIVREVVQQTITHHLKSDPEGELKNKFVNEGLGIRITISSGYGDLSIASLNKEPVMYIVVFQPYISYEREKKGVSEFVAKIVKEPKAFVHAKTIDYIENAMMANFSKEKGGYQGIKALQNGVLLQAAMANIAFIFGKEFATPRFQTVIEGTTIKKLLIYVEQLVKEGVLEKISFRDITIEQAYTASEMLVIGGDKIVPVLSFNQRSIGQERGKVTELLQEWYQKMNEKGTPLKCLEFL